MQGYLFSRLLIFEAAQLCIEQSASAIPHPSVEAGYERSVRQLRVANLFKANSDGACTDGWVRLKLEQEYTGEC